jgi:pimeloyl-ACP methyl ester carboxylesterase
VRARWIWAALALAACRAAPIPPERRYPAGTALTAKFIMVAGTRLRYVEAGKGPSVVLIHGFGASIYTWHRTIEPLAAAGFHVVAFDNKGFGFSDKPTHGYSNADYARLVLALIDSLHLPDPVLVGHSMGGAIAAETALRGPSRVRGLVLVDAAGLGTRGALGVSAARGPVLGPVAASLRSRWVAAELLRSTYADPSKVTEADIDQYYAAVAEPDFARALRGVLREFRFDALRGRLAAIQVPCLVVWGDHDRLIPERLGRELAHDLLRSAFIEVPNAGHDVPEEAPDVFNHTLIAFLEHGVPATPRDLALASGANRQEE